MIKGLVAPAAPVAAINPLIVAALMSGEPSAATAVALDQRSFLPSRLRWPAVNVDAPRRAVTLDEVRAHRAEIERLGGRYGMRNIRVFGSVARGEAGAASDLDLLVDVERGHGYFDMAGFALGVEELLGVFTQVATSGGLKARIRQRVLHEAVAL